MIRLYPLVLSPLLPGLTLIDVQSKCTPQRQLHQCLPPTTGHPLSLPALLLYLPQLTLPLLRQETRVPDYTTHCVDYGMNAGWQRLKVRFAGSSAYLSLPMIRLSPFRSS